MTNAAKKVLCPCFHMIKTFAYILVVVVAVFAIIFHLAA